MRMTCLCCHPTVYHVVDICASCFLLPCCVPFPGPPTRERQGLERAAAEAAVTALKANPGGGDVLVFLPGVAEIRR
jgi:hypothetical protein